MSTPDPLIITVAPNGARKTDKDHPALPIGPEQLADVAQSCNEAGAQMIHLHVRDKDHRHLLDADAYRAAITAIEKRLGRDMIIQVTTEAVGLYKPAEQMAVVRDLRPAATSLAIREICPDQASETEAAPFFEWLTRERISPQFILYDVADIERFHDLQARGLIAEDRANVLLVLGRYTSGQQSDPQDILPMLAAMHRDKVHWAVCAFGAREGACALTAVGLGGHARVGFENNMLLTDGHIAPGNADLVRQVASVAPNLGRKLANVDEARAIMGVHR